MVRSVSLEVPGGSKFSLLYDIREVKISSYDFYRKPVVDRVFFCDETKSFFAAVAGLLLFAPVWP